MDEMTAALKFFENKADQKVFTIRPIDEKEHEHGIYLVNSTYIVRMYRPRAGDPFYPGQRGEGHFVFHDYLTKRPYPFPPLFVYDRRGNKIELYYGPVHPRFAEGGFEKTKSEAFRVLSSILAMQGISISDRKSDLIERFYKYKKISGEALPEGFERSIVDATAKLIDTEEPVFAHRHLHVSNILIVEDTAQFVDLRFCGASTPLLDIASLCEENEFDTSLSRACLVRFNDLRNGKRAYTFEDLTALILFLDAFWFYWGMAMNRYSKMPRLAETALKRKRHFFLAFEAYCMEGHL